MEDRQLERRGDDFDLGQGGSGLVDKERMGALEPYLSNPQQLMNILNINEKQAKNVKSILVASGTGAAHRYLSELIGGPLAGAVGGFLSGIIADKLTGTGRSKQ